MPELHYISPVRFPTEKAHGLQIAQNCEALTEIGYDVTLWVSNRKNSPEMDAIPDSYAHYGVTSNFVIRRIASIDLYPLAMGNTRLEYIAFWIHTLSFSVMLILAMLRTKDSVYYSRDKYILIALSLILPREKLAYEVHQFASSKIGTSIQGMASKRAGHIIAVTPKLQENFINRYDVPPEKIMLAHDGIRTARFSQLPSKYEARQQLGWDDSAFIIGYSGRLHTMGMDKGVGLLVNASAQLEGLTLAIVGGPDEMADELEQEWLARGGDSNAFLKIGTVKPDEVPVYLRAFDVCAIPLPRGEYFSYYTSPLKLFEYMAAGRAILGTDLPSITQVVTHSETAYIVEPENVEAFREGIIALKNDVSLRDVLGQNARDLVFQDYTWAVRAERIKAHLERDSS